MLDGRDDLDWRAHNISLPIQGMKSLNSDKVAAAGFLAVVPDFFFGDPANLIDPHFDRDAWLKNNTTDKGYEDAKPVIAALRSKDVSAIGAAGICWGGALWIYKK
ncbi:hypothetical protein Ddye_001669 [Dipteronia dyeriana]|uniref:Dienelactone hydrolase domain-containing protein n=1 Tax=Dipteronia dyeriana TaxID=168575 RepID=A0AAD9XPP5_9ROSI|nr:hypothetical protein Ddye_001669 [Dipteronia dyeriana]